MISLRYHVISIDAVFLALAEQLAGRAGHYGTAGNAQAVIPEIAD